ncbi:hypothetical protein [Kitasatospora sp. CB01950]|uniref:hypothetical protein n=1 Tax=Kitasatospora sp. CB01950 TaxID=1703930 RepID=UPI000938B7C4|nr:hypothetical protein [Kitasatospora sp. CB01950]OKJ10462.1 hypothetical protein AMK19_16690 [Kitasatospora sp. CB01950]
MSEPEAETVETVGTEDRPAIGAARLEAMFDGLRREVVLAVPVPPSEEMVRRGVRRGRYRAGAVAMAGVLGVAVLWSAAELVPPPPGHGHGVAGYPVPPTAAASGPSEVRSLPEPQLPLLPSANSEVEWAPLESADAVVRALTLDVSRMPSVLGGYGPWTAFPVADQVATGTASPGSTTAAGPSANADSAVGNGTSSTASRPATQSASRAPGQETNRTASRPAGQTPGASGSASGPPGVDAFADGCVSRLVRTSGAVQLWEQRYVDAGHPEATAQQVVMRFESPLAAEYQASRLMGGGECVSSGAGWTVEQQVGAVVALGVRQPVAYAEEAVVHISGTMVAVLTVRRGGRGVSPAAGLSDPFRESALEFLQLRASEPEAG